MLSVAANLLLLNTQSVLAQTSSSNTQPNTPPNILMIAVDDLNTDIGAWGGKGITPNIDKLASQSVQFQNAYTVVPACNPSRVAVLTGLRPETTGQYSNPGNFRNLPGGKDIITIGQFYQQQGYNTVAAGKVFHKPRGKGAKPMAHSDPISWDQQFKTLVGTQGKEPYIDKNKKVKWLKGQTSFEGQSMSKYLTEHGFWGPIDQPIEKTGDWNTARFCHDFLQKKQEKVFFLACGIFRPHSPQLAPSEFFDLYPYAEVALPKDPEADLADLPKISKRNFSSSFAKAAMADKAEWKRAIQAYLASVSFADATIGHILEGLEKSQYKDNTVVVLWSDHGFQMGQKNRWEKFSLWRLATHSPLIIKAPNISAAKVDTPVSLLDIFPTLVDLTGMKTTLPLEGNVLTPLMKNKNIEWNKPAVITYGKGNHSVVYQDYNFIQYNDGSIELYNHSSDPEERTNLANKPEHAKLIEQYRAWIPDKAKWK